MPWAKPHARLQNPQTKAHHGSVNLVCDGALDEHVWVSVQTISLQEVEVLEALQYSPVLNVMVLGTDEPQH